MLVVDQIQPDFQKVHPTDVVAMKEDERHFRVTVSVAVSNQFYGWVFGLGKSVRIVGPESVVQGMKKALADISERYPDD